MKLCPIVAGGRSCRLLEARTHLTVVQRNLTNVHRCGMSHVGGWQGVVLQVDTCLCMLLARTATATQSSCAIKVQATGIAALMQNMGGASAIETTEGLWYYAR